LKTPYDKNMRILVQRTQRGLEKIKFTIKYFEHETKSTQDMQVEIWSYLFISALAYLYYLGHRKCFVFEHLCLLLSLSRDICLLRSSSLSGSYALDFSMVQICLFLFQESFFCPHSLLYPLRLILMILMILIFIEELSLRLFTFCS